MQTHTHTHWHTETHTHTHKTQAICKHRFNGDHSPPSYLFVTLERRLQSAILISWVPKALSSKFFKKKGAVEVRLKRLERFQQIPAVDRQNFNRISTAVEINRFNRTSTEAWNVWRSCMVPGNDVGLFALTIEHFSVPPKSFIQDTFCMSLWKLQCTTCKFGFWRVPWTSMPVALIFLRSAMTLIPLWTILISASSNQASDSKVITLASTSQQTRDCLGTLPVTNVCVFKNSATFYKVQVLPL